MEWLKGLGLLGLFIGSLAGATILPFSSDFLIVGAILAKFNLLAILLCATTGSFLGSIFTYYIGYSCKWDWIERRLKIKKERIERHKKSVEKWGAPLALFCWTPFIGDLFSLALGFYRVKFIPVAIYTFIGKFLRVGFWIVLWFIFGSKIGEWI